eukprot:Platyproteum_vivax@DN5514_c0_g1_i1.p1
MSTYTDDTRVLRSGRRYNSEADSVASDLSDTMSARMHSIKKRIAANDTPSAIPMASLDSPRAEARLLPSISERHEGSYETSSYISKKVSNTPLKNTSRNFQTPSTSLKPSYFDSSVLGQTYESFKPSTKTYAWKKQSPTIPPASIVLITLVVMVVGFIMWKILIVKNPQDPIISTPGLAKEVRDVLLETDSRNEKRFKQLELSLLPQIRDLTETHKEITSKQVKLQDFAEELKLKLSKVETTGKENNQKLQKELEGIMKEIAKINGKQAAYESNIDSKKTGLGKQLADLLLRIESIEKARKTVSTGKITKEELASLEEGQRQVAKTEIQIELEKFKKEMGLVVKRDTDEAKKNVEELQIEFNDVRKELGTKIDDFFTKIQDKQTQLDNAIFSIQKNLNEKTSEMDGKLDWASTALGGHIDSSLTTRGVGRNWRDLTLNFVASANKRYWRYAPAVSSPPGAMLAPDAPKVGTCFAFSKVGNVTIEFHYPLESATFVVEHSRVEWQSAPRTFNLYGWHTEENTHISEHLGSFSFPKAQQASFPIASRHPINKLTAEFLTNWGATYTCLYSLKVYGEPVKPEIENL